MISVVRSSTAALVLTCCLFAQERDQRRATVGMRSYIEGLVVEGSELVAAPTTMKAPLIVRILAVWPHGEHLRYDLEWAGFEPGTYDLMDYLRREDGGAISAESGPSVEVEVLSVLPGDMFEPSELTSTRGERLGGYSTQQIIMGAGWVLGLAMILFAGRKRRRAPAPQEVEPTLADRLRPLVERVSRGGAAEHEKAELERLLVAFWRARLDLSELRAGEAVMAIRADEEAGALLRQVEAWLHAPSPAQDVDVSALLEPYRSVQADQFRPEAR